MRELWRIDVTIRFPLIVEATWEDSTTDADVISAILKNEAILDDIILAAIDGSSRHAFFLRIHHWKLFKPLSVLTNIDLDTLISSLRQERTFLERRLSH